LWALLLLLLKKSKRRRDNSEGRGTAGSDLEGKLLVEGFIVVVGGQSTRKELMILDEAKYEVIGKEVNGEAARYPAEVDGGNFQSL
jgi:hypothetical protein